MNSRRSRCFRVSIVVLLLPRMALWVPRCPYLVRVTFYTCSGASVNESGKSRSDGPDGDVVDQLAGRPRRVADGPHDQAVGAAQDRQKRAVLPVEWHDLWHLAGGEDLGAHVMLARAVGRHISAQPGLPAPPFAGAQAEETAQHRHQEQMPADHGRNRV